MTEQSNESMNRKGLWNKGAKQDKSSEQTCLSTNTISSFPEAWTSSKHQWFSPSPQLFSVQVTKFSLDTHDKYAAAPHMWLLGENCALPGSQRLQMCHVNQRAELPILNLRPITITSDSSRITHTEIQSHKQEKLGGARTQDSSQLQTQRVSQWDPLQV